MAHQPGDTGDNGNIRIFLQPHSVLQRLLTLILPLHQGLVVEVGGKAGGAGWILKLGVNAIYNALNLFPLLMDNAI